VQEVMTEIPRAPQTSRRSIGLVVGLTVAVALLTGVLGFGGGYWSRAGALEEAENRFAGATVALSDLRETLADNNAELRSVKADLAQTEQDVSYWIGQDQLHARGWNCAKDLVRAFRGSTITYSYRALPIINSPDCQKVSKGKWEIN
jgi:hypothetical protein